MSQIILKCEKFGLSRGLHDMLAAGELVDVTLACQGEFIQAHKNVLAACSPHFRSVFKLNTWQHHVVYMQDAELSKLQALVEFMYKGEVTVNDTDLPGFLKLAEALKVSGLTTLEKEQESRVSNEEKQQPVSSKNITSTPKSPPTKTARRSRDATKGVPLSEATPAPNREIICQDQGSWQQPTTEAVGQLLHPAHIKVEAEDAYDDDQSSVNLEDCILEEVDENQEDDFDGETTQGDNAAWYEAGPSTSTQINSTPSISHPSVSSRGRKLRKVERLLEAYDILQSPDSPDDSTIFTCKFCDKKFKTRLNFRKHLKSKHDNEQHSLSSGSRRFTLDSLERTCDVCYDEFENHSQLMEHKRNKHFFELDNGQFINMSRQIKSEANQYQCEICLKSYVSNFSLQRHKKCHPMPMSDIIITDLRSLKVESDSENESNHLELNEPVNVEKVKTECKLEQIPCEVCNRIFTRKHYLLVHYKFKHPEMLTPSDFPFSCNLCIKQFAQFRTLKWHMKAAHNATPEITVKCRACREEFKSNELLAKHQLTVHAVQARFQCLYCTKSYLRKGDVNRHMKRHNTNEQNTETGGT